MKIFIDTTKWIITKQESEYPILTGNNYVDKVKVYFNADPDTAHFYPTINILKPNNRKVGPLDFDTATPTYPLTYTDSDSNTWYYYEFTISSNDKIIDVKGQYQITIIINLYSGNNIIGQRGVNCLLNVVNAVTNSDNDILILGESPDDVVASLYTIVQALSTSNGNLSNSKADRNNSLQSIIAGTINSGTFNLPGAELTGGEHYTFLYADYPDSSVNSIIIGVDSADHGIEIRYGYNNGNLVDYISLTADGDTSLTLNGATGIITFYPSSNGSEYKFDDDGFIFKNEDGDTLSWVNGTLDLDGNKITGLAVPTGNTDATTKKYVDDLIDALQSGKVNVSDVIDALNSTETTKPLSAKQGKVLKDALDTLYSYVGFATEDDVDTTINKLREVFAFLTGALDNQTIIDLLNEKQNVIDSSNKLDADLVDDTNSTHKFVSASEKAQITNNENAISGILDGTALDSFGDVEGALNDKEDTLNKVTSLSSSSTDTEYPSAKCVYDSIDGIFLTDAEMTTMLSEVFD